MDPEEERSTTHRLAALLMGLDLLPGILGFVSQYWLSGDSYNRHVGLWKVCTSSMKCQPLDYDRIPDWFNAVKALGIMSILLHGVAVLIGNCCARLGCYDFNFTFMARMEEICAIIAGIFMLGGLTLFARSTGTHPLFCTFQFDWSFWLVVVHVGLLFLTATMIALDRHDRQLWHWLTRCGRRQEDKNPNPAPKVLRGHRRRTIYTRRVPVNRASLKADLSTSNNNKKHDFNETTRDSVFRHTIVKFHDEVTYEPDVSDGENSGRKNSFLHTLKLPESQKYFTSLEGIPHLLHSLTHPEEHESEQKGPSVV